MSEQKRNERMLWLIKMILFGHVHKWEILEHGRLYDNGTTESESKEMLPCGKWYVLRCEVCGTVKEVST